ncbi:hypothetical protein [Pseudomonas sp. SDO52101_S400]
MRDVPNGDQPSIFKVVEGEIRTERHVSISSVSVIDGEVRVHSASGNSIDIHVPGLDGVLRFDLDAAQQVQVVERQAVEDPKVPVASSVSAFEWKTLLITFVVWNVVGLFSGVLGFFAAAGYFCYQWRQVAKRKKLLSNGPSMQPTSSQVQDRAQANPSKLSRQNVRDALARHR